MTSKHQSRRKMIRATRRSLPLTAGNSADLRAMLTACFDALQEEFMDGAALESAFDLNARAINQLRQLCGVLTVGQDTLERKIRASAGWQACTDELKQIQAQEELLCEKLPEFVWERATQLVSKSPDETFAWIKGSQYAVLSSTIDHMLEIATYRQLNRFTAPKRKSKGLNFASEWRPMIRSAGGVKYFLCFTVAFGMLSQLMAVYYVVQGSGPVANPFSYASFFNLLNDSMEFWLNQYRPLVIALAAIPETHRVQFIECISWQRRAVDSIVTNAIVQNSSVERQKALLEKQAVSLRKSLIVKEEKLAHLGASYDALMERLHTTTSRAVAHPASANSTKKIDALVLRDKDTRIGQLQKSLAESEEQLALTRQLLTVLLEPSPEACAGPLQCTHELDPDAWRIVFVGGHERLHTKLRKRMRNAVFLHPDQSRISPDIFEGVDAVIFSIGYCNHTLSYRAADEVRRRGLRAGYSNFTNVDMVLDEVRAVMFPGGEKSEQQAA